MQFLDFGLSHWLVEDGLDLPQNLRDGPDQLLLELTMGWVFLVVAGLLEVGWAVGLKYTEGFSRLMPSILTIACMIASLGFLGLALRTLPLGTAYAVWTGIGTIGTVALGIALFAEPATAFRLTCVGLILAGIVGLKFA